MTDSTLQDRLLAHSKAFDGLLSLIPAKLYYGEEDTSTQWQKKKQTKEQAAAAKRAKLNPDSAKSAKDILDEKATKRKLDDLQDQYEMSDIEGMEMEQPKQGLKIALTPINKKQKTNKTSSESLSSQASKNQSIAEVDNAAIVAKVEQKSLNQERKKEKSTFKAEKLKKRKGKSILQTMNLADENFGDLQSKNDRDEATTAEYTISARDEIENVEADGLVEEERVDRSSASASPHPTSIFDAPTTSSTTTSTSSIIPPATAPKHIKVPTDPELLKSRLAARIEALRAARKADGPNGAPARNRQELMEARRKKEEQRRAHKKELRLKAKSEEEARREEALVSARDSPASSMMSPAIHSASENNFSFGRVAFADGMQLSEDLSSLLSAPKCKGPSDAATALQASENKRLRIASLDDEKRADIEEKDVWLNAKKRAHGVKVRDDTSLLKKTLKRKEKQKKRSEKEWGERKEGVAKGQAMRQKKREDNLRKRRDEKGTKGGKKMGSKGKKPKPKSRPGFEGSFSSGGKRK